MAAYYNENDPYVAEWLRNLVGAGLIALGDVDDRPIQEVRAADVGGYEQCHFFAGIGGWSCALRLAGWPDDRPVWTGSCPCQPLSTGGARRGHADARHLWPVWAGLIAKCAPAVVFGEQVAGALGREWLSAVRLDMEALGYACGAADLPAASVGAPHIRQRLWWVADAGYGDEHQRFNVGKATRRCEGEVWQQRLWSDVRNGGYASSMGDADRSGPQKRERNGRVQREALDASEGQAVECGGDPSSMANSECNGGWSDESQREAQGRIVDGRLDPWSGCDWLPCTDGKSRPIEPSIQPLAHGVPARVGALRAAGNAIVPQVAAEFIGAYAAP